MTPELFYRGLSWDDYWLTIQSNRLLLQRKCENFVLPVEEAKRWAKSDVAHVLVFTEDWCQDSVSAWPPLKAIDKVAAFDLSIMRRSEALALQQALTGREYPTVPTFIFYDSQWRERGRYVGTPKRFIEMKNDPHEALWLKEMYDELWWECELEELAAFA